MAPASVLDAGCGTGRVAIELSRRGIAVIGVDRDPSMLATARRLAPGIEWVVADLAQVDLKQGFEVVVMAGNVLLFTPSGTEAAAVVGCARHVAAGGALVAGFQLGPSYHLWTCDDHCRQVGLVLESRCSTWQRDRWPGDGSYAVSVHRRSR